MASHWRDDPKYDDMIVFNCRGGNERAIADAMSDYLTSGNGRGKFGSFGSQHGGLSVWMTNRTDLDDVEDLIDFMQSNGAYTTEYDIKKIRRRFGVSASRGVRKRSIKASRFGGYQSFGNSGNPFADIEALKDAFIKEWWRDYDGDPETGWDNIFENALADFEAYANDEASGFLMEQYENGEIGDGDMRNEFDQFTMWKDMNEYDF